MRAGARGRRRERRRSALDTARGIDAERAEPSRRLHRA